MTRAQWVAGVILGTAILGGTLVTLGLWRMLVDYPVLAGGPKAPGQPAAESPQQTPDPGTPAAPSSPAVPASPSPNGGASGDYHEVQLPEDSDLWPLVDGLSNSVLVGRTGYTDGGVTLPLHFKSPARPGTLRIAVGHPNGTRYTIYFDKAALELPVNFGELSDRAFDDFGRLATERGYYLQAGEHDFDGDGEPELVLAVGDGIVNLAVSVFKYHPPARPVDASRSENWELLGVFDGQQLARVEGPTVVLPYGSFGLFEGQTLVKGKFVRTN